VIFVRSLTHSFEPTFSAEKFYEHTALPSFATLTPKLARNVTTRLW
jgi:hypothetical protein